MPYDECDDCTKNINYSTKELSKIIKDKDLISGDCKTCHK